MTPTPDTLVPKHVFDLKAGGVETSSTAMMDICHMKMENPNLAARASDKIGRLQDWAHWAHEPNLAGAKRIEKKSQSCIIIGLKSGKWKVESGKSQSWKRPILSQQRR